MFHNLTAEQWAGLTALIAAILGAFGTITGVYLRSMRTERIRVEKLAMDQISSFMAFLENQRNRADERDARWQTFLMSEQDKTRDLIHRIVDERRQDQDKIALIVQDARGMMATNIAALTATQVISGKLHDYLVRNNGSA